MENDVMRSDSYACISMGETYSDLGRYEEAIKWFEKATVINSQDGYAYYCIGCALRKLGNFPRAIENFAKALQITPDDGSAALGIAEAYSSVGDYKNAAEWFDAADKRFRKNIAANPEDDKLYAGLGSACKGLENDAEAIKAYEKAVYLNPENNDAKTMLNELRNKVLAQERKPATKPAQAQSEEKLKSYFSDAIERTGASGANSSQGETLLQIFTELDGFVGLNSVKKEILTLVNFIEVQNSRSDLGLKTSPVSYHLVFTGNAGTGKTTIAKFLGKIYKHLGILENGRLVEAVRSDLVGEKFGHSAQKVNKTVDEAMGGILFIDDAVALAESKNDFVREAVSALAKRMDGEKNKLVVILAGQTAQMSNFMELNSALAARFTRYIEFPDYTPDEMLNIFKKNCLELEYRLNEKAALKLRELFKNVYATRDGSFSNAIFVRNVFEKTIERQASRVVKFNKLTKELLTVIDAEDIPGN